MTKDAQLTVLYTVTDRHAFVWANEPSADDYAPSAGYAHNPWGAVRIRRSGVGRYLVDLQGAPLGGGNVQVTAYGETPAIARVVNWGAGISVACDGYDGAPVDTRFSLLFVRDAEAYVWASSPEAADYAPSSAYLRNPGGGGVRIRRSEPGRYVVTFEGLAVGKGTVHVSPYGGKVAVATVESWGGSEVRVRTRAPSGAPLDTYFTLLYSSSDAEAYAWANDPASASYDAGAPYSNNPAGRGVHITRASEGRYEVSFPGRTGAGGNVQVSGYGGTFAACRVVRWSSFAVYVACDDPSASGAGVEPPSPPAPPPSAPPPPVSPPPPPVSPPAAPPDASESIAIHAGGDWASVMMLVVSVTNRDGHSQDVVLSAQGASATVPIAARGARYRVRTVRSDGPPTEGDWQRVPADGRIEVAPETGSKAHLGDEVAVSLDVYALDEGAPPRKLPGPGELSLRLDREGAESLRGVGLQAPLKVIKALVGHGAGDAVDVDLEPSEAFGQLVASHPVTIPAAQFEGEPVVGSYFTLDDGHTYWILSVEGGQVHADVNHPYAGYKLRLSVQVKTVTHAPR